MQIDELTLPGDWRVVESAETLAELVTADILRVAHEAIEERGAFHFITAGGSTPNRCYQMLSSSQAEWSKWHVYMGDERVLPFADKDRNAQALLSNWISKVDIPLSQVHLMNTEVGSEQCAKAYADLISAVDAFDLCLLGMGEDGHTASLFPRHHLSASVEYVLGSEDEPSCPSVLIEYDSPKAPPERVSLNYCAFAKCRQVYKLVTGESKQDAVSKWIHHSDLPIAKVSGGMDAVWVSRESLPTVINR